MTFSTRFWRLFLLYAALLALFAGMMGVMAAWHSAGIWIGLVTLVWLGLGALATWYAVAQVTQPLARLSQSVRELAVGEDGKPPSANAADEMAMLSADVEQIRRKLNRGVGELQTNAERLQAVLSSMREGVLAIGPDKTILLANDAARELLEFSATEPQGRPFLEVTRVRPVFDAVQDAFAQGEPIQREFDAVGTQRRRLALRANRLPGNPCPGVMVVLHDVSEIRRLENLRRELVANVSHELKTPLAAIKAYAETLRLGAVNDPEHNLVFVARIEEQAERLHQLILDMLQIARVEAGDETFDIVDVPLREVFDECAAQFADAAAARKIEFRVDAPGEDVLVRADEEGVRTILSNLVDNALKYTPEGGCVTVRATSNHRFVALEVQDTGIGIAEKEQARVFERFYRADKARS
ncbi:MAG: PAS domain-containing protein, partial [Pirellulaceae bacterium]|nr:PAS domain-containing protein [Pirellulaceae bacterium]